MTAMSIRDGRRPRSFLIRDDLIDAFEARATELSCSVDWLLGEAMKRLLADRALAPPPPPLPRPSGPPRVAPPPLPRRKPTGSFVATKTQLLEGIALRSADLRVVVDRDRFVIGRSAREAQLAIRDGNVSRQHAMIERGPEGWMVVDMASTNGVQLNGARVTRAPIRIGDVIGIGPFTIRVERA